MHRLPPRGFTRFWFLRRTVLRRCWPTHGPVLFVLLPLILRVDICAHAQDTGTTATEFHGTGVALTVIVHDAAGNPIPSVAMVKLFRGGTIPSGQTETEHGRAELVAYDLGDFTVVAEAPGYASAQKEVSINANGRAEVDIYLRSLSTPTPASAPGRPLLAPKAKKAVDQAFAALAANDLGKAQKQAAQAMSLAPGHPDVLYLQGVILLKQRDWSRAQQFLEKATQVESSSASAFVALGMALFDQKKYDAAVAPLEKALKLNPSSWDARWTLARTYYQEERYDQALEMSQAALSSSNGKEPEIELLVAQSLTAVGRYEDAAQTLRAFLRDHPDRQEAATAQRWLNGLTANGKIHGR